MPRKTASRQPGPAPIAYSYIRFSHPDQAKGDSVRRQEALRDAWLERNGAALDTSLKPDQGVSGYTGKHRENPDRHALAAFLKLVEAGRVARGSYLLIENLDRLSREDEVPACHLLTGILLAGVKVVQLSPYEMVLTEKSNGWELMRAVMELSRGHGESAIKSERVGGAWAEKKKAAREGKPQPGKNSSPVAGTGVITRRVPAWLRVEGGKYVVDDEKAATVRRVYRMAASGSGLGAIARKLNAEGVPPISTGKRCGKYWGRSYVAKLLGDRRAVGEYQPHTGRGSSRRPDGDPVPGHYPAVVTEDEWNAARSGAAGRRNREGRPPNVGVNLFAGLLKDARDGGGIHRIDKGKKGGGPQLVSYLAANGVRGAKWASFPAEVFERAVLSELREINPREVLKQDGGAADRLQALGGKVERLTGRIEKIKAQLVGGDESPSLVSVLQTLDDQLAAAKEERAAAEREAACPLSAAWGECHTLLDALEAAPDKNEARLRLRSALRRIVQEARCLFLGRGAHRLAAVQFWFAGGEHRDYLILYKPATGGSVGERPARTWVRSLADAAALGPLDLRKAAHAKRLEVALLAVELDAV